MISQHLEELIYNQQTFSDFVNQTYLFIFATIL